MGGLARAPPDGAKPINTDGKGGAGRGPRPLWPRLTRAPPTHAGEPERGAGAYAEADVTGGSAYALAGPAHGHALGHALPAFPRSQLRFREKLGEGQFGEVSHAPCNKPRPFKGVTTPTIISLHP